MVARETSGQIDEAAAAWAARLDRGGLAAEERAALDAWTARDPRRLGALARALALLAPQATAPAAATPRTPRPGKARG